MSVVMRSLSKTMVRRSIGCLAVALLWLAVTPAAPGQSERAGDESYFSETVYPILHAAECNRCHNDNGVASETDLQFPAADAGREQVAAFGLKLMDFVDREYPDESLLFLKPTNREEHTGGERIKPGSAEEKKLLAWIKYLAGLSEEQVRQARAKIARAEQRGLAALTIRRLTHSQYNNTVRDLLGDQSQPANQFPKEDFVHGFTNQLEGQGISPIQAEAYSQAAERLASGAFRGGDRLGLIPAMPESPADAACAELFVRRFGLKTFRRPLAEDEVSLYTELLKQESRRSGDFMEGAKLVVEAMLQSPHFLFRVERGTGSRWAEYEAASRLSYFLWDTMPSDELLRAAERGALSRPDEIETVARRMLEDPRAKSSMEQFLAQWMRFDRVLTATRDRRRFGAFNGELAAAMVEETRRLFNHLVWEDKNFMEFFTADYTFVSSDLARLYDLPEPSEEFAKVQYPADSGRSGVLGHGTFLVLTSKPAETSPTERGVFVRNHFLGHDVPAPPAGVNAVLPEVTEAAPMTNRQRLAIHLNSESCAGCHRLIDPIGFGFEQYNAIGAFEEKMPLQFRRGRYSEGEGPTAVELEVDTSAYIQGIADSQFSTPKELGRLLAGNEASQKCIVKQLFRYAFGRQETEDDHPVIEAVLKKFRDSGFRFRELIVALVTSRLFLQRGESDGVAQ